MCPIYRRNLGCSVRDSASADIIGLGYYMATSRLYKTSIPVILYPHGFIGNPNTRFVSSQSPKFQHLLDRSTFSASKGGAESVSACPRCPPGCTVDLLLV